MLRASYRLVGWLLLPAALLIALILFAPFAATFATWALLKPEAAGLLLFLALAFVFIGKGIRAASTLISLMRHGSPRRRAREAGLRAVSEAVNQRTVVR